MKKIRIFNIVVLCFVLSGCARFYIAESFNSYDSNLAGYTLSADSIAQLVPFDKKKFVIIPTMDSIDINSLQFQEYAACVKRYLELYGYTFVNDPVKANGAITLAYGMGDPERLTYNFSIPVWGQTGYSSASTKTSYRYNYNQTGIDTNSQTSYQPNYGVTGYRNESVSVTQYSRFITIGAIDLKFYKKNKKLKEYWVTKITSTGRSNDLRVAFPFLIAGADSAIGQDTRGIVELHSSSSNPVYTYLKNEKTPIYFSAKFDSQENTLEITNKNYFQWENIDIDLQNESLNVEESKLRLHLDSLEPNVPKVIMLKKSSNELKWSLITVFCDTFYGSGSYDSYFVPERITYDN